MRSVRLPKSRVLQASLLLSVLTSVPSFAYMQEQMSGTLIAQSTVESSSSSAQTSPGTGSTKQETSTTSESSSPTQGSATQTTSTSSTSSAPAAGATSASTTSSGSTSTMSTSTNSTDPAQGPLLDKRKLVLSKIQAAKKQGTGISGYMAEYERIEGMVKNGEPEANYADRLASLQNGIDDQLKRSQLLKTQRPTYVGTSSSSSSSSSGSSSSGGGGSGGGGHGGHGGGGPMGGMSIEQLKAKYGDKVPPDIAEKLSSMSPETRQKLLDSDMLKKFLNK